MKFLITILITVTLYTFSQPLYEHQFVPFDGKANVLFGRDVAVSDSFIFIGSRGDDNYSGSVYVYKNINNDWIFWKKLFASDKQEFYRFGTVLFLDDNKLFIGSTGARVNNIPSGAVYLFTFENGDWLEKQKIIPPTLQFGGSFSISISRYENYLLIGANDYDYIYEYAGKAFLYEEKNNSYIFIQELVPSDPQYIGRFGSSVTMDNSFMLIGSVQDSTSSGEFSGSVYLFIKEDTIWVEKEKYLPDSSSANLGYGGSIAIDSNYVFIGAHGDIGYVGPGSVYIYEKSLSDLKLIQKINSGEGYNFDNFGYPIVVMGDSILIGASSDTTKGNITGSSYLFVHKNGQWEKKIKFTPSDEENANDYGISIDFNNGNFLIGAPGTIVNGLRTGKAYLYNDNPVNVEEIYSGMPEEFELYQNYPNPFNPTTRIRYFISQKQFIQLRVYDILGNVVAILIDKEQPAGEYKIDFNGSELASGIYFYQLKAGEFSLTKKAILIK